MPLPGHGIAKDYRRAIGIQRPLRIAVILQRLTGASDAPFLRLIHALDDARRDGQTPLHRVPSKFADPTTNLGVSLVGRGRIRIVIEIRVPTFGPDVAYAVAAILNVLPEGRDVWSIGQDGPNPDNCDCSMGSVFHDGTP